MLKRSSGLWILSSVSIILLTITFELHEILQNISRKVVGNVLINISPSNIFSNMLSFERFHQNCQAVLAVVSINELMFTTLFGLYLSHTRCGIEMAS